MAGLQAIETLKATGGESDFFSRWSGILAKVMVGRAANEPLRPLPGDGPRLLSSLGTVAILGIGALHIMSGALTIGGLVAFQSFMASFLGPLGGMVDMGASLQEVEGQMNRLDDVLHTPVASEFSEIDPPANQFWKTRGVREAWTRFRSRNCPRLPACRGRS